LTDALKLPTSSRSPDGFTQFETLFPNGLSEVEKVSTKGGYTFFVPVDDAFGTISPVKESLVCPSILPTSYIVLVHWSRVVTSMV
jgi:hypothetical protein